MLSVEDEWLIAAYNRAPSHDDSFMWFMLAIGFMVIWDQARQLGESEEYWMERLRVIWCQIQSFKVVAPHVSIKDRVGCALLQ
jgi:hypothetical protein